MQNFNKYINSIKELNQATKFCLNFKNLIKVGIDILRWNLKPDKKFLTEIFFFCLSEKTYVVETTYEKSFLVICIQNLQ